MQNRNVKVSVITPVYNGEKFLEETIRSVLNQTFTDFEYLLINHASTDASMQIIQKYQAVDDRIRVVELSVNKGGPAYPRNEGIKAAKGEFIAFVDADDVWKEDKLQKQVEFLNFHAEIDMIYTTAEIIDEYGKIRQVKKQTLYIFLSKILTPKEMILYVNYINMNTLVIRNSIMNTFSEDKRLVAIEDWMFHIVNLANGHKGMMLNEPLIYYRVHASSISYRNTDKSYRKIFYMFAVLFMDSNISFRQFMIANMLNIVKLLRRRWTIFRSSN